MIARVLSSVLLSALATQSTFALDIEEINEPGLYAKGQSGYVKLAPYNHDYLDFKYFNELPYVERNSGPLELVACIEGGISLYTQANAWHIAIVGDKDTLDFSATSLPKEGCHHLISKTNVATDRVLVFDQYSWINGAAAIVLGNTEKELEKLFEVNGSAKGDAKSKSHHIKSAIKAFPNNKNLKSLEAKWEENAIIEKANKDFALASDAWSKYRSADKAASRLMHLRNVERLAQFYLNNYPKGKDKSQMRSWLDQAKKEIPELEKKI